MTVTGDVVYLVEDDRVTMTRRLTCPRCRASCMFNLCPSVRRDTRRYEAAHECVPVAVPWSGGVDETVIFLRGVVRVLRGLSRHHRCDRRIIYQLAMIVKGASKHLTLKQ